MDLLISIFETLVLAGGPFCVFSRMGKSTDSGKTGQLAFRNFCSSDNSVTITDGPINITFSANGGTSNPILPACEIGLGAGLGIISNWRLCVTTETNYKSIFNPIWTNCNDGLSWGGRYSQLIFNSKYSCGETINLIQYMQEPSIANSVIIGGGYHRFCKYNVYTEIPRSSVKRSAIIGGRDHIISPLYKDLYASSTDSVIAGGIQNCVYFSNSSLIVSSKMSALSFTDTSSVISSQHSGNYLPKGGGAYKSRNNIIIGGYYQYIGQFGKQCESLVVGSVNRIKNEDPLNPDSRSNFIIGRNNGIYGDSPGYNREVSKFNATIGCGNYIRSSFSTIIGRQNSIKGYYNNDFCKIIGNTMISSRYNCLYFGSYYYSLGGCYNTFISGKYNLIQSYRGYTTKYNTVIASENSSICYQFGTIIGSKRSQLKYSCNSIILNSRGNNSETRGIITAAPNSVMISSRYSDICNSANGSIISSKCSFLAGTKGLSSATLTSASSSNIASDGGVILSSKNSILFNAINGFIGSSLNSKICSTFGGTTSTILSSCLGVICGPNYNTIIGTKKSCTEFSKNTEIIGGECNTIQNSCYSVIIGGNSNRISGSCYASIIGGFNISNTRNHTTHAQNVFIRDCFYVGKTHSGITGAWGGGGSITICRGIVINTF